MGTEISRRTMLAMTGSAAVAAVLPAAPAQAVAKFTPAAAVEHVPKVAWAVGTPGESDWQHIVARSAEDARRAWVNEHVGGSCCEVAEEIADAGGLQAYLDDGGEPPTIPCECEWCVSFAGSEATRIPAWDGSASGSASNADWLRAGLGTICSRCGYECSESEGTGRAVRCEAVCDECMTLADWRIVDPAHAAEIEAEMIEDGVLPAAAPGDDAGRRTLSGAEAEDRAARSVERHDVFLLFCGFCGAPESGEDEAAYLVRGPIVCICDRCVTTCAEVIENRRALSGAEGEGGGDGR